jgi:hypothetical protein
MQGLVNFGSIMTNQIDLSQITSQIVNLKSIIQMISTNKLIDLGIVKILSDHKNLFQMYLASNG